MTKTWLITGTSSGFGKALATLVAKHEDLNLIATARHLEDMAYLDTLDHGQILKTVLDVTDEATIQTTVTQGLQRFETIDVLVNNAGLGYFATIEESDMAQVRHMFEVNVFGLANMTQAVLPTMRAQKSGVIVNLSSALGITTLPTMGYYSATKYAVEGYSDTLRQEVAALGIHVLNVEPSGARTQWAGRSSHKTLPKIADYAQFNDSIANVSDSVTGAPGDPEKIAQVILDQVTSDQVPEHLALGNFAYEGGLKTMTAHLEELKQHEAISKSTDD